MLVSCLSRLVVCMLIGAALPTDWWLLLLAHARSLALALPGSSWRFPPAGRVGSASAVWASGCAYATAANNPWAIVLHSTCTQLYLITDVLDIENCLPSDSLSNSTGTPALSLLWQVLACLPPSLPFSVPPPPLSLSVSPPLPVRSTCGYILTLYAPQWGPFSCQQEMYYRRPCLQWHRLQWHSTYSDIFSRSQMINLLVNYLCLQWQSG